MLDLDRIEALVNAATPGPWRQATHVGEPRAIVAESRPMASLLALDVDGMAIVDSEADAALIVEACNAVHAMAAELRAARAEIERLRGLVPELPPRPPEGDGVPRYGLRWGGPSQPVAVPMVDGYWTPWHLAEREIERLRTAAADERADVIAALADRAARARSYPRTDLGDGVADALDDMAEEIRSGAHVGAATGGER